MQEWNHRIDPSVVYGVIPVGDDAYEIYKDGKYIGTVNKMEWEDNYEQRAG